MNEENQYFHWDRLISATIDRNWTSVRESCEALSIELESKEGEIKQNMEK